MVVVKWNSSGGACAVACPDSLVTDDWGRLVGDPILYFVACILYSPFEFI